MVQPQNSQHSQYITLSLPSMYSIDKTMLCHTEAVTSVNWASLIVDNDLISLVSHSNAFFLSGGFVQFSSLIESATNMESVAFYFIQVGQALLTRLTERQCQGEVALAYIADRWGSQEGGWSDISGADR